MSVFMRIGCCVAGAPADAEAVDWAARLRADGGRVSLVHVAPSPRPGGAIEGAGAAPAAGPRPADLDALAARIPGADLVVLEGPPGPAICRWAADADAELLVLAARQGHWDATVLGSVTRQVVDHSGCAVLVVRGTRAIAGDHGADAASRHRPV